MNESSVSIYIEHEDNDNWMNMCDVVNVEPRVDNDAVQGEGLEELDIDVDDPDFELNDAVELSKSDDEDMIMVQENVTNKKENGQPENDMGCSEQPEVSGHRGVQGDELGDGVEDSDDISSPPVSKDGEI